MSTMILIICIALSLYPTLISTADEVNVISINSSLKLESWLESSSEIRQEVVLELDCSHDYELTPGMFTYIINSTLTIRSNSESIPVNVFCLKPTNITYYHPTRGLAFVNSSLNITMINFISCGTHLSQLPSSIVNILNSTKHFLYPHTSSAALLFINCWLTVSNVTIDSSFGFAIVGHNLHSSHLTFLNINNSVKKPKTYSNMDIGSGFLLYFSNSKTRLSPRKIFLKNVTLENNLDQTKAYCPFWKNIRLYHAMKYVLNAAGLTILYTQHRYEVKVHIHGAIMSNNIGQVAGSALIFQYRSSSSLTSITDSIFRDNDIMGECYTGDVTFVIINIKNNHRQIFPLYLEDVHVHYGHKEISPHAVKHAHGGKALVYIAMQYSDANINIAVKKLDFSLATKQASERNCIDVAKHDDTGSINITLSDMTVVNSRNTKHKLLQSLLYFENIQNVSFMGKGIFENNQGSVIHAQDSNVFVYGKQTFVNNTAENGAAIKVEGNGRLYFMKNLRATFIGNQALFSAGAIYVDSSTSRQCGMQFEDNQNTSFIFANNLGTTAGNSVFLNPVQYCEHNGHYHDSLIHQFNKYLSLSTSPENNQTANKLLELSTIPEIMNVMYKKNDKLVSIRFAQLLKYPGQSFPLFIDVHDVDDRHVYSFINTGIFTDNNNENGVHLWLQQTGGNIAYEGIDINLMNLSIHTNTEQRKNAMLVFSIPKIYTKSVKVQLMPCPLGFILDVSSGSCKCSELISIKLPGTQCTIYDSIISVPNNTMNPWMGLAAANSNSTLAVSKVCPKSYCHGNNNDPFNRYFIKSVNDSFVLVNGNDNQDIIPYCLGNRQGVLCGRCKENFSVVFGSGDCQQCSNLWLLVLLGYAIVGPLLILVLFIFNLTLTKGTFNGAIFYAQVTKAGILESMYTHHQTLQTFFQFLLSVLNMNHFFPTCFYNGMNQLWKTGLNSIFSYYLLLIVVLIIVISRYSTWLSNKTSHSSVQVLVTVVHLSFSKLLLSLIDVFTPATVYVSNTPSTPLTVWYWDGSVQYMGPSHYPLVIFTGVIVSLMLVPYIGLLVMGKLLIKHSKRANFYIRPVYEAIHAPYKDNKHHWFVARMLLLILIYVLYVIFRTNSYSVFCLIVSTLLCIFTVMQALTCPFKSNALNILDCWLMVNITVVFTTLGEDVSLAVSITFNTVAIVLALLTVAGILVYHVVVSTKCGRLIFKRVSEIVENQCFIKFCKRKDRSIPIGSYYEAFDQCREPLLMEGQISD